jgi:hypothetical protein
MASNDTDNLERWKRVLSPAEMRTLKWIMQDPTRPFCSADLIESSGIGSKGTARNIICKLKRARLIELYCKSIYAFYKLQTADRSKVNKLMTLSRMGDKPRRIQINFSALLDSLPFEELCKVHDVRLVFKANGLYDALLEKEPHKPNLISKDIFFGSFDWGKYRSIQVNLHQKGNVSFIVSCSNFPVESSDIGFLCLAAFLGGVRNELLSKWKTICHTITEASLPSVEDWRVSQWHYGRDSAQEFSGEAFNITFKMWCGELARIYTHKHEKCQKVRMEMIQAPDKPLRDAIAGKLNLCCGGCKWCSKP